MTPEHAQASAARDQSWKDAEEIEPVLMHIHDSSAPGQPIRIDPDYLPLVMHAVCLVLGEIHYRRGLAKLAEEGLTNDERA